MNRKLLSLLLCLAVFLSIPGTAFADKVIITGGTSSSDNGYINSMSVRFRSGPGTDYSVIATYNTGKSVEILDNSGTWAKVKIDGVTGYVLNDFVSENVREPVAVETPAPTSSASKGADPFATGSADAGTVTGSNYTVPEPDGSSSVSEPSGTSSGPIIVSNSKRKNPFAVTSSAATPAPAVSTPAPAQSQSQSGSTQTLTPTPTPAPTATPASSSGSTAQSSSTAGPSTGKITGDYVRFRTGPSTSYSIISSYNKGKEVVITGTANEWTACTIDGKSGYVFSQYVKADSVTAAASDTGSSGTTAAVTPTPAPTTAPAPASTVSKAGYIAGNNVRFRSGPSLDAEIIGEFYFANAVTITGKSGDWTAVAANGKTGYVFSTYVKEGTYTAASTAESASKTQGQSGSNTSQTTASGSGSAVVSYAMQFLGTRYVWGGTSPEEGFDCSGFVYYVYKHFNVTLNRVAQDQASNGTHVDASNLQPGDILCFYSSGSYIGHSGIYIGDNKFIHSGNSSTGVIITDLSGGYATRGFEARRIF